MTSHNSLRAWTRAPYATFWERSKGRLVYEKPSSMRTPFQRDRDRVIHATAFRRLMHKTQVFVSPEGDHFRTRLTHSLEVAQIARTLARALHIDEDLTETIALAHDFGHPPFGHAGEEALNTLMKEAGGFDHNVQTLKILTLLEKRSEHFKGLNLTWESLEGIIKHNGPLTHPAPFVEEYAARHTLSLQGLCGLEGQIAAIADDIAYNHHDLDDGIRAGLFSLQDVRRTLEDTDLSSHRIHSISHWIGTMVEDVLTETRKNLAAYTITSAEDVRHHQAPTVHFSEEGQRRIRTLKTFLTENMYHAPSVLTQAQKGKEVLTTLFLHYVEHPGALPQVWQQAFDHADDSARVVIADYIAGMTDRYAQLEVARLC